MPAEQWGDFKRAPVPISKSYDPFRNGCMGNGGAALKGIAHRRDPLGRPRRGVLVHLKWLCIQRSTARFFRVVVFYRRDEFSPEPNV